MKDAKYFFIGLFWILALVLGIVFVISTTPVAQADWKKVSELNNDFISYYDKHTCENAHGECVEIPNALTSEIGVLKLANATKDNLEAPIWGTRSMIESCETLEECALKHETKECTDGRWSVYSKSSPYEVWCNKMIGYEQVFSHKIAVIDEGAKAVRDAQRQAEDQEKTLDAQIEKRINCGNKTIREASKMNALKGFTNAQVMAFSAQFSDIASLLSLGATDSANELIQASIPNELISQEELNQLSSFLTSCVGGV